MKNVVNRAIMANKKIFVICQCLLVIALCANAQTPFDEANTAYAEGRYDDAASLYQALIDETPDAVVYYNLGNVRYKQGELAQAILCYERALRLRPNYADAKYNLQFAQSRITDNIPEQDFFLSDWARTIRNSLSEPTWMLLSINLFVLMLAMLLLFLLGRTVWVRKTAFHVAWLALLFSVISGINTASLHRRDTLRNEAVITQGVVNAKSAPDRSGTDLFSVHEGTKVTIRETIGDWANIRVGSNQGWIRLQCLERI